MYKGSTYRYTENKTDQLCERDLRRSAVLQFLSSRKASQKLLSSCQLGKAELFTHVDCFECTSVPRSASTRLMGDWLSATQPVGEFRNLVRLALRRGQTEQCSSPSRSYRAAGTQLENGSREEEGGGDLLTQLLADSPVSLWLPPVRPRSSSSLSRVRSRLAQTLALDSVTRRLAVLVPQSCSSQGEVEEEENQGAVKEQMHSQMSCQGLIWTVVFIILCRAEADTVTQKNVVELGGNATLSCLLTGSYEIMQVTWQKKNNSETENLATYSVTHGVTIVETYRDRLNFTRLSLNDTAISLWKVRVQDDGCYTCIFNTYPSGAILQVTCLTVYGKLRGSLHYVVSEGSLTATCSATAWPRPVISWIVPKAKGEETEEVVTHHNGTVSIINKLYVNSSTSLAGQSLICRVWHMEKNTDYSVKLTGRWISVPWLLATVALVVVFIVLVVTVVCWRRHRKKQSESRAF